MAERFVTYMTEDAEAGKVPVNGDGVLDPAKFGGGFRVIHAGAIDHDTAIELAKSAQPHVYITGDGLAALIVSYDVRFSNGMGGVMLNAYGIGGDGNSANDVNQIWQEDISSSEEDEIKTAWNALG